MNTLLFYLLALLRLRARKAETPNNNPPPVPPPLPEKPEPEEEVLAEPVATQPPQRKESAIVLKYLEQMINPVVVMPGEDGNKKVGTVKHFFHLQQKVEVPVDWSPVELPKKVKITSTSGRNGELRPLRIPKIPALEWRKITLYRMGHPPDRIFGRPQYLFEKR